MSELLSKDALWQAAADLPTEDVPLIDPKGTKVGVVRMRGLTGTETERYQQSVHSGKQMSFKNAVTRLIVMSAVNEDGKLMFDPRDMLKLGQSPSWMLMQLFEVAGRLSGLSEDDVREMTSDFDDAQSEPSSSDSL